MHFEVEQKFRTGNLAAIREALVAMGAVFEEQIEQADSYFSHPARDFIVTDEALRLRQVGEENFVTYKGPKLDQKTKTRRELELPLSPGRESFDQFSELLTALGFGRVGTVRKQRVPVRLEWEGASVEVALDEVGGVGTFVELEIFAEEPDLDAAWSKLASLAARLGLTENERRSYLEMWLKELT